MGKGDRRRLIGRIGFRLALALVVLLCAWPVSAVDAHRVPVAVREIQVDPGADIDIQALRSGRFQPPLAAPVDQVRTGSQRSGWWRITTTMPVAADDRPQLLLRQPFLRRVEAWVPGRTEPVQAALYGEHADPAHAARALVIDLPGGIPAGEAVWLRVDGRSAQPMPVAIEPLARVRSDDLAHVAWRTMVLSVLLVLALLAFVFRIGTGESSFAWFGGMLGFAVLYLVALGGDARLFPGAELLFGTSRTHVIAGGLGVACSNLFQRSYLDLPGRLPRLDRLLWLGTALSLACSLGALVARAPWQALAGNIGLILSASLLLVGSTLLAMRGDRPGRVVMLSWLPLMLFTTLMASQLMGLWPGRPWLAEGLAASFALASLLMAVGLADKLLELRRDRDQASAAAVADRLTGLLNRAGIEAGLRQVLRLAQESGRSMSIAFVDLDDFKRVNDAHGHGVGDQCLRVVSRRVSDQLRNGDLIGRYGGDEFLVVLPATEEGDALAVAERMRAAVNGHLLTIDALRLRATLSIGVAESTAGDSIESLLERADLALYASKQAGRNRVSGSGCEAPAVQPA